MSNILTTSSSNGHLLALHVPPSPLTARGSTVRLSVRLYDAAISLQLKSTVVASVDVADGVVVELALENTSDTSSSSSSSSSSPSSSPSFLAARLCSDDRSHPAKIIVWDLTRGVVACTLSSPAATSYRGVALHGGKLYALTANGENGKVVVMEYDVTAAGAESGKEVGKLKRKIKCSTLDVDDLDSGGGGGGGGGIKLGMAISNDGTKLAVRLGSTMRILDVESGKKLVKCKVRGDGSSSSSPNAAGAGAASTPGGAGSAAAAAAAAAAVPVLFSSDSTLLATVTTAGLSVFSSAEGGKALYTIRSKSEYITSAAIRNIEGGKYAILTCEPGGGCAYLSEATSSSTSTSSSSSSSSSKKKVEITSTLKCTNNSRGIAAATFHSTSPGSKIVVLVMPTTTTTTGPGSSGNVELMEVNYRDEDGNMTKGEINVGSEGDDEDEEKDDGGGNKKKKKRKTLPSGELVLGPGEGGGEALGVTDRSSKRAKVVGGGGDDMDDEGGAEDEDDFVLPDDDAEEEAAGGTIADRLAKLTSELEREEDDTDEESEDEEAAAVLFGGKGGKKKKVKATSESLATLLRQALSSNDDGQLEVALHVSDKKVIENSIAALAKDDETAEVEGDEEGRGGMIIALLSKLVTRLARKPGRAEELSVWIRTVLLALISSRGGGKRMGKTERDVAARLGPLRNLLNERVESLPHLLRLEGRLSLLGQQL